MLPQQPSPFQSSTTICLNSSVRLSNNSDVNSNNVNSSARPNSEPNGRLNNVWSNRDRLNDRNSKGSLNNSDWRKSNVSNSNESNSRDRQRLSISIDWNSTDWNENDKKRRVLICSDRNGSDRNESESQALVRRQKRPLLLQPPLPLLQQQFLLHPDESLQLLMFLLPLLQSLLVASLLTSSLLKTVPLRPQQLL